MFHSMVVVGNLLVIYGGLLSQQDQPGLEGVCPSNDVTLVDLAVDCNGRPTLTLAGAYMCILIIVHNVIHVLVRILCLKVYMCV